MKYEIGHSTKLSLKIALIWNAIALVLNYMIYPVVRYNNGAPFAEALLTLIFMMTLSIPFFVIDCILYKKIMTEATKKLLIIALSMSILSVVFMIKLPSILMVAMYLKVLIKDKVE